MTASLAIACVLYALILAVGTAGYALARRPFPRAVKVGAGVLEAGLLIQAVIILLAVVVGGARPDEPVPHLAYAVTSVLLIPVAFGVGGRESTLWSGLVVAVALVVVVVVVARMQATWGAHA